MQFGDEKEPFEIPNNWKWVKLSNIYDIIMGQSPNGNCIVSSTTRNMEFHQGKVFFGDRVIQKSDVETTDVTKIAPPNSVLLCVRAPVGKVNITDRELCIGRGLCAVTSPYIPNMFTYFLLQSLEGVFCKKATGTTFKAITNEVILNQVIALPPLEEQNRIVAKLEQILPLISDLS